MSQFDLPEDRREAIEEQTKQEFGIKDDDWWRVRRIGTWSGWIAFAVVVALSAVIWKVWGGAAVFFLWITLVGPTAIALPLHSFLKDRATRWLVPMWPAFEKTKSERIAAAAAAFKREVLETAAYWERLDGHAFEHEFARLLMGNGIAAEVTKGSGDGGVDIIAADRHGSIAIQCKRYAKPVGPAVIRELYGVVQAGSYSLGILAVTGGVTKGVREFVEGKPLRIVDLPQIVQLQMKLNGEARGELPRDDRIIR